MRVTKYNKMAKQIHIGTSGWSYDHWAGVFYPEDLKKRQWLAHYSQHFDTVELNMSFYRYPFTNMLKGWRNKLPENFEMTFKAHRQITHRKKFQQVEDELKRFYEMTTQMGSRTGCILFQTPPSFHKNSHNLEILKSFLELTEPQRKNILEFRHPSWWDQETPDLLQRYNVGFCTVSGLNMPSDIMYSSDAGYFRFHGPGQPYASAYSNEQLQQWAAVMRDLLNQQKVKEIYAYFNNDFYGYAVRDAKTLRSFLESGQ